MKFSVLLSVYIKEKPSYLELALKSIWDDQTLKPNEIVVIKDGPLNEELDNIIALFTKRAPVKLIVLEKNVGLSEALNIGLKECAYPLVARMDTDDISLPQRFETQIQYFETSPNLDVLGSKANKIDKEGTEIGELNVPVSNAEIKKYIWTCPFIHPTVMFKKESIIKAGGYKKEAGPRQDDYDLWFRCGSLNFNFENIDNKLLLYRFFEVNVVKNNVRVGWYRFKTGLRGCISNHCSFIAYIGILIPFLRSLLPYPLNIWFYKFANKFNPRDK